jgi:hypothetical protein
MRSNVVAAPDERPRLASALVPARRTKATRAIDAPKLSDPLEAVGADTLEDELTWRHALVEGDAATREVDGVDIEACRLRSVLLTGARLTRLHINDSVLEGCDLSGAFLEDAVLQRVELHSCRLLGWQAPMTRWQDVRLVDCRLDEANLRMGQGEHVTFESCSMRSVDLYETRWERARFFDCDLTAARFDKVRMPGARFHGSTLDDLVGADHLRTAVIAPDQLVPMGVRVLAALQMTIDEDREPGQDGSRQAKA